MYGFSIGEAWSRAMDFFRQHSTTVWICAAISVLVPFLLLMLVGGGALMSAGMMANRDPMALLGIFGPAFFLTMLVAMAVQFGSLYSAWRSGLSGESLGQTIGYGLMAGVLTFLVFAVIWFLIALVFVLLIGGLGAGASLTGSSAGSAAAGGLIGLLALLLLPTIAYFFGRFSAMGPIMAEARSINPFFGMGQSWRLTAPHQWPLFGYMLLIGVIVVIAALIGMMIAGLFGAIFGPIGGEAVKTLLTNIPIQAFFIAMPVGIYRAIVGNTDQEVFR